MNANTEAELKRLKRRIILTQVIGTPGAVILGLGLYGVFGTNGDAFHPLLNDKNIVAGLVIIGVAIEIWQFVVLIPLFRKQIKLMNERNVK
jgi:hypothetical protein